MQKAGKISLSVQSAKELVTLSKAGSLKKDMRVVVSQRHNPFVKEGRVDADAYIEFVTGYNEFINHAPKPFKRMIDKKMKL